MQQTIIQFEDEHKSSDNINLIGWCRNQCVKINKWLNGKSEFYSRIADFSISRLTVIRVNMVTLCLLACAFAIEHSPIVAIVTAICAGWLVYRLNKKGEKK